MRRIPSPILAAVAVAFVATALAGCRTSPIRLDALQPASQADLEVLSVDVSKDRENVKAGFDAVAKDLEAANLAATETKAIAAQVQRHADEIGARPTSGGIPGALVSVIAGSGVLPPWLDWAVTLLGTAFGINVQRNRSRAKALAKVSAPRASTGSAPVPPSAAPSSTPAA